MSMNHAYNIKAKTIGCFPKTHFQIVAAVLLKLYPDAQPDFIAAIAKRVLSANRRGK